MAEFTSLNGYQVKDTVARSIAKGRNQAVAFTDYATMIETLNEYEKDEYKAGQNVYIGVVGVPDLWVYSVEDIRHTFIYESDDDIVEKLKNNTTVQVGFFKLAMLEGQKVDLTTYDQHLSKHDDDITELKNKSTETNNDLTASDNLKFRFATDGEGNYGYLGADDSFIPFKSGADYTVVDYQYYNNGTNTATTQFTITIPEDGYYIFCTGYRASAKPETLTTTVTVLNTIKNEYSTTTNNGTTVYQKNYAYLINATKGQNFTYTTSYYALIKINNAKNTPNITSLYQLKNGGQNVDGVNYSYENTSSMRVILIYSGISAYTERIMCNWAFEDNNTPILHTNVLPICQNGYGGVQILQVEPKSKLNAILWYRAYNASDVYLVEY